MAEGIKTEATAYIKYADPDAVDYVYVEFVIKVPKEVRRVLRLDDETTGYSVVFDNEGHWIFLKLFPKNV
jgi:hypothetical protein